MAQGNDGLDAILNELSIQNSPGYGARPVAEAAKDEDDDWDWDEKEDVPQLERVMSDQVRRIAKSLREYIHDMADSDVR